MKTEGFWLNAPAGPLSNPQAQFQQFIITAYLLEQQLEDWRLYSHQGPKHAQWALQIARRNRPLARIRNLVVSAIS